MKKNYRAARAWKFLVLVQEPLSLHTGIVYRGGVTRRATPPVKYASSNRDGLQIPRGEEETIIRPRLVAISEYPECTSAAHRSASCCRSLALTFTVVLLMKHMFAVLHGGMEDYPFTLLTVLILRATGIIFPMLILMRTITAIQNSIRRQYEYQYEYQDSEDDTSNFIGANEDEDQHHSV
ncbi:hypothetical protein SO802_033805 [Lithocarpus litseifolius]|uniref:Uncharacterized protein n=1 Tax=Lithocarpus litseifolius TaxID=425828 RepID=A0AAW2BHB3_9ROSI